MVSLRSRVALFHTLLYKLTLCPDCTAGPMDHGVYIDDGMPALMTTTYQLQGNEAYGFNMLRKMDTNKPNIKR